MANTRKLIRRYAQKYGVDPRAALSIARYESGGKWYGAVGDHGTSFGPFQLHVGGALPRGKGAAWANSPAGIEYAIRKMAGSGARGKRGIAAISAISRNFERPADPSKEIRTAASYYGGFGNVGMGGGGGGRARPNARRQPTGGGGFRPVGPAVSPMLGEMISQLSGVPELGALIGMMGGGQQQMRPPKMPKAGNMRTRGGMAGGMGAGMGGGQGIWVNPNHKSTHQTSGLPGYPAYDYMAPAGTPVRIMEPVQVFRHSGKSPRKGGSPGGPMGYSVYAKGLKTGKTYFITHLGKVAPLGRYQRGAVIGRVATNKWAPGWSQTHAHVGIHG